jgi:hypothetical protein
MSGPGHEGRGPVLGTIRDGSGAPVQGASAEFRNLLTDATTATFTGSDGSFHVLGLPRGPYRISVTKPGFALLRRETLALRVGDRLRLDLQVEVADASETIEVNEAAPVLQESRGSAGFVVEEKKVVALPLDGCNFVPLISLSPGVSLSPGSLLPRINGSRPRVSEYIYDGISVLQPEPGQVAYYPNVDASKNSAWRRTATRLSTVDRTAASSWSARNRGRMSFMARRSSSSAMRS